MFVAYDCDLTSSQQDGHRGQDVAVQILSEEPLSAAKLQLRTQRGVSAFRSRPGFSRVQAGGSSGRVKGRFRGVLGCFRGVLLPCGWRSRLQLFTVATVVS